MAIVESQNNRPTKMMTVMMAKTVTTVPATSLLEVVALASGVVEAEAGWMTELVEPSADGIRLVVGVLVKPDGQDLMVELVLPTELTTDERAFDPIESMTETTKIKHSRDVLEQDWKWTHLISDR